MIRKTVLIATLLISVSYLAAECVSCTQRNLSKMSRSDRRKERAHLADMCKAANASLAQECERKQSELPREVFGYYQIEGECSKKGCLECKCEGYSTNSLN